jgi:hypothetical protein
LLRDRVEDFIARRAHPDELYQLLKECVQDGTVEGLACARRLFEDSYGGLTYNYELKAPAAATLVVWGEAGIQSLVDAALATRTSKNISLCIQILSSVAAGTAVPPVAFVRDAALAERIHAAQTASLGIARSCRRQLVDLVLSLESDDDVASYIGSALHRTALPADVSAAKEIFAALSARWLVVSKPVLERYERLIDEQGDDEPAFQRFLTQHPQLLDPMVAQIWVQPNLFGSRFPDFVLRRADDTYAVVEIECPGKPLVTKEGQLSAHVTHAEKQATDYRNYLMQHFADARRHFPNFDDPDCLVVVGKERALDDQQKAALRDANRHRHRVRIVGFDWLADRAHIVAGNLTWHDVEVTQLRVT